MNTNIKLLWSIVAVLSLLSASILIPAIIKFFAWAFKKKKYTQMGTSSQIRLIHQLYEAVQELSSNKVGAIITITNKQKLDSLRTDGIILDANISASLLISIFNKKSPLHDGSVIIEGGKIKYAATYYKITQSSVNNKYGARHRAALGISEQSDALTLIVSEETGKVSYTSHGKIAPLKLSTFQEDISKLLNEK